MFKIGSDYAGQKWPKIALAVAAIFNFAMFFSPLAKLPASKGDIMFFAVPDVVIFLAARTFTYPVTDVHTRAVRQQLIVGLILALAFCAIILAILLAPNAYLTKGSFVVGTGKATFPVQGADSCPLQQILPKGTFRGSGAARPVSTRLGGADIRH
jgi:hypothetical protein